MAAPVGRVLLLVSFSDSDHGDANNNDYRPSLSAPHPTPTAVLDARPCLQSSADVSV